MAPQWLPPLTIRKIPVDGLLDAALESFVGAPTKLCLEPRCIDGIALIVPRSVVYETYERAVRWLIWEAGIQEVANASDDVEVGALVASTDVVLHAGLALF